MYFWVISCQVIESADLNGRRRRVLVQGADHVYHPYGLTIAGDYLYWSDWDTKSIMSANKDTGAEIRTVVSKLKRLGDIHAVQIGSRGIMNNITYSKGLLVCGFSWFVANPFIFNVLLGKNDFGYIPLTSSPPSYLDLIFLNLTPEKKDCVVFPCCWVRPYPGRVDLCICAHEFLFLWTKAHFFVFFPR